MAFAWKVIGSLTAGMLIAFVSGDIFIIHESSKYHDTSASLGWYYPLCLLFFSSVMYLAQSEPLSFREHRYLYAFVGMVTICFFGFLLFHL